jgi:hypothetical protein
MKNYLYLLAILCLFITACDPASGGENDAELITTVTYTLTPVAGGSPIVLSFKDLDGAGGNAPIIIGATLPSNTEYTGEVSLKNEAATPVVELNQQIIEESTAHQVFISVTEGLINSIQYLYKDLDSRGRPLGLKTSLKTRAVGKGSLAVILRHNPNKEASGVINGQIGNAGGESDVEAIFPIEVK